MDVVRLTYPNAIPSLSQSIPDLPSLGDLDTNTSIHAGHLKNAKTVLEQLKWTETPINPDVTEDMVLSAELRLQAIKHARFCIAVIVYYSSAIDVYVQIAEGKRIYAARTRMDWYQQLILDR
ncbi:hypothetical protein H0H81_010483 [Sphagnurus paluster]|uniref:Uncharacterized protein n=1 Tax=Sphagnurus paluster TaxID=117069 RepID=A0A9P7FP34_9AGAR|nr:hypothetical protein H0H81_010483 [Sphagnurus paluster]